MLKDLFKKKTTEPLPEIQRLRSLSGPEMMSIPYNWVKEVAVAAADPEWGGIATIGVGAGKFGFIDKNEGPTFGHYIMVDGLKITVQEKHAGRDDLQARERSFEYFVFCQPADSTREAAYYITSKMTYGDAGLRPSEAPDSNIPPEMFFKAVGPTELFDALRKTLTNHDFLFINPIERAFEEIAAREFTETPHMLVLTKRCYNGPFAPDVSIMTHTRSQGPARAPA